MRKRNKTLQVGRKKGHREAMLKNMSASLFLNKRIFTTVAKAKALQRYVEPLITKSKTDTIHKRRQVFSKVEDKKAVRELFDAISKKVGDRPGGYTRILKTGFRQSDGAEKCLIELVDYNENMLKKPKKKKKKTRRGGGSSKRGSRGKGKSKRGSRGKGKKKKKKSKKQSKKKSEKKGKKKKGKSKKKKSSKKKGGKKKSSSKSSKSKKKGKKKSSKRKESKKGKSEKKKDKSKKKNKDDQKNSDKKS